MASTVIKNWDNKTWLSSKNYILNFNNFLVKVNKLDSSTFNWQDCPITPDRVTYEVIESDEKS